MLDTFLSSHTLKLAWPVGSAILGKVHDAQSPPQGAHFHEDISFTPVVGSQRRSRGNNGLVRGFNGCVLHTRWILFIKLKPIDFVRLTAWHESRNAFSPLPASKDESINWWRFRYAIPHCLI